jgi:hypothetical protein
VRDSRFTIVPSSLSHKKSTSLATGESTDSVDKLCAHTPPPSLRNSEKATATRTSARPITAALALPRMRRSRARREGKRKGVRALLCITFLLAWTATATTPAASPAPDLGPAGVDRADADGADAPELAAAPQQFVRSRFTRPRHATLRTYTTAVRAGASARRTRCRFGGAWRAVL